MGGRLRGASLNDTTKELISLPKRRKRELGVGKGRKGHCNFEGRENEWKKEVAIRSVEKRNTTSGERPIKKKKKKKKKKKIQPQNKKKTKNRKKKKIRKKQTNQKKQKIKTKKHKKKLNGSY